VVGAVDRQFTPPRSKIRSVVMEAMLHMALVANILNTIGATPWIAHPIAVPRYPEGACPV
jgi:hypothetical protein